MTDDIHMTVTMTVDRDRARINIACPTHGHSVVDMPIHHVPAIAHAAFEITMTLGPEAVIELAKSLASAIREHSPVECFTNEAIADLKAQLAAGQILRHN